MTALRISPKVLLAVVCLLVILPTVHAQTTQITNVQYPKQIVTNSIDRLQVTASITYTVPKQSPTVTKQPPNDNYILSASLGNDPTYCDSVNGCSGEVGKVYASPIPCERVSFMVPPRAGNPDRLMMKCLIEVPKGSSGTELLTFDFSPIGNNPVSTVGPWALNIVAGLGTWTQFWPYISGSGSVYRIVIQVVNPVTSQEATKPYSTTNSQTSNEIPFLQANAEWLAPITIVAILAVGFLVFRIASKKTR